MKLNPAGLTLRAGLGAALGLASLLGSLAIPGSAARAATAPAARVTHLGPAACVELTDAVTSFSSSPAAKIALTLFSRSPVSATPRTAAQLESFHRSMGVLAGFAKALDADLKGSAAAEDLQVTRLARSLETASPARIRAVTTALRADSRLATMAAGFQKSIATLFSSCSVGAS